MTRALLASLLLCLVTAVLAAQTSQVQSHASAQQPKLRAGTFDPPRQAPAFALQGSNGSQLTLDAHRGKVVVLGFGFTSCPDVCPTTLAVLAQAMRQLGKLAEQTQVIYITVDPERDTPEQMKKYLATFHPSFLGGTGSANTLERVRKEYGIAAEKKVYGNNYSVAHSSYVYFIDRKGRLRALMPYGRTAADFAHDIKALLAE